MVDESAVSRLITALQSLQTSNEWYSGRYEQLWVDETIVGDRCADLCEFVQNYALT